MTKCRNHALLVAQLAVDLDALIPPLHAMIADYLWEQKRCEMGVGSIFGPIVGKKRSLTYSCGCKHGVYGHCFIRKDYDSTEVLEYIKRDKQGVFVFRDIQYDTFFCIYPTGFFTRIHQCPQSDYMISCRKLWYTIFASVFESGFRV